MQRGSYFEKGKPKKNVTFFRGGSARSPFEDTEVKNCIALVKANSFRRNAKEKVAGMLATKREIRPKPKSKDS